MDRGMPYASAVDVERLLVKLLKDCEKLKKIKVVTADKKGLEALVKEAIKSSFVVVMPVSGEITTKENVEIEKMRFALVAGSRSLRGHGAATVGDTNIGVLQIVSFVQDALRAAKVPFGNIHLELTRWQVYEPVSAVALCQMDVEVELVRPVAGSITEMQEFYGAGYNG